MKKSLTSFPVARHFKSFLRREKIPYYQHNSTVVVTCRKFPPIVITWNEFGVNARKVDEIEFSFSFPAPTLTILFEKLIQFRLINTAVLTKHLKRAA